MPVKKATKKIIKKGSLQDLKKSIESLNKPKVLIKKEPSTPSLEKVYKALARLNYQLQEAQEKLSFVDEAETLAAAAFKAGKAFNTLTDGIDKLEELLDEIYDNNDFVWYTEIEEL